MKVGVSGRLDASRMIELQELDVAFVPKPCSSDELVRAMRLGKARRVRASWAPPSPPGPRSAGETAADRRKAALWPDRVRALLAGPELVVTDRAPLQKMVRLLMARTLEGRGAFWRELAEALSRSPESQSSDTYVRQQIHALRYGILTKLGVALKHKRRRGYYFEDKEP